MGEITVKIFVGKQHTNSGIYFKQINLNNMRINRIAMTFILVLTFSLSYGQKENANSDTRKFVFNAEMTQVNRDWSVSADFTSGIGEVVSFYPVESIDLKTNQKVKSLQMDMYLENYFKFSWIDFEEVNEFIYFIEHYVIPNLKVKTEITKSVTYIFNSKEITLSFKIKNNVKRISIYQKDNGVTDDVHYFWTETQVNKIQDLLAVLKQIE